MRIILFSSKAHDRESFSAAARPTAWQVHHQELTPPLKAPRAWFAGSPVNRVQHRA